LLRDPKLWPRRRQPEQPHNPGSVTPRQKLIMLAPLLGILALFERATCAIETRDGLAEVIAQPQIADDSHLDCVAHYSSP
jgi:hypothetical protein